MVNTTLFDVSDRVALLTGASKGMGRAMAEGLAEHGARVMISSRKVDQCAAAAAEINAHIGEERVYFHACNAGYKDQLKALVDATHDRLGPVDILVGNAGTNPFYGPMSQLPDEAYDKVMTTNVKANHWLAQMVAPDMVAKGRGSIMITASTGAFGPSTTTGVYNISKLAVIGLVRNIAAEFGRHGVRANAICPGLIMTDFAEALWNSPEAHDRESQSTALKRLGVADDFKGVAVFLASDASAYMTGQAVTVCGGQRMWT